MLQRLQNFTTVNGVTDTELRMWGVGITQNVDAAASTLYLSYGTPRPKSPALAPTWPPRSLRRVLLACWRPAKNLQTEHIHAIIGGAVVRF